MIDLDNPVIDAACPACAAPLRAHGWYMPGMRMLARARCTGCGHDWFLDLPAGQGIYSPVVLDPATGAVHDRTGVPWFADWLRLSYRDRSAESPPFKVIRHAPITRPAVLINCIDMLYGHAVLKLLNAQQYLDSGSVDVLLLVQPCLRPLIPGGVAEVWEVDLPLAEGTAWSDGLAAVIAAQAERFAELRLAPVHPHIHPRTFAIERFSKVTPFALAAWHEKPVGTVTFIWREDRPWRPGGGLLRRGQTGAVVAFFEALRRLLPGLDAAVAGLGDPGGLPDWIADMRARRPEGEIERSWLRRYAASHAVVGMHGSNMLLPSAHAGSTFELLPEERDGNVLQDILPNGTDPRDILFRYRFVRPDIAPAKLARLVALVVARYPDFDRMMAFDAAHDPDVRP